MRFCIIGVLAIAAVAGPVRADQLEELEEPEQTRPRLTFWEWIADPAARDIEVILEKTSGVLVALEDPTEGNVSDSQLVATRGMLRYGLSRSPDHAQLLVAMGRVADAMGRPREALAALERFIAVAPEHGSAGEVRVLKGQILAQLGDDGAAEQVLLEVLTRPVRPPVRDAALMTLAWLHMRGGHADRAVDLLAGSAPSAIVSYNRSPLPQLVLAIALDRDGQLTRAHQVITDLTKATPLLDQLTQHTHTLASMRFLDPLDRHYTAAFVYELAGLLPDSLTEWQLYLRAADSPYRGRAAQHVRDVTLLLRKQQAAGAPR